MRKLWILLRIGQVAARRYVDVVKLDTAEQLDGRMAAIGAGAPSTNLRRFERHARDNVDSVIALHPMDEHVPITDSLERLAGEQRRRARSKEGLLPSPLPKTGDGESHKESKAAIRACPGGENGMRRFGTNLSSFHAARTAAGTPPRAD